VLLVTTIGSGKLTHLGAFTFIAPHLTNLATLQNPGGTQTLTAANGDTITAQIISSDNHFDFATGHIVGRVGMTITGGTGRFEGASGGYVFSFDFDPATLSSTSTFDGELVRARGKGHA
jgi:hypothetical protein